MRIFTQSTLREFWERHPNAEAPLRIWHNRARKEDWTTPADVAGLWPRVSIVGGNRAVFRIKGNDYRLVVDIAYQYGEVYIKFIGTHAEYDRINVMEV